MISQVDSANIRRQEMVTEGKGCWHCNDICSWAPIGLQNYGWKLYVENVEKCWKSFAELLVCAYVCQGRASYT